ncbi:alpha/beta fold hydrolase [Streptomyces sp. BE147]|uniref:alpha/beta fold hydrolase n=1 Tax=unclassified Streptomyces TaxID=2593676 RepID=UPI002E78D7EB|nr:alpha/beta fold hydrolase [Streptomyces sp. BE147]MEE1742032.1 alpha/beta fold hydrolase [Streptomyces sp. BE147]
MHADTGRPAFLLVHGAWHGAWCWDSVRAELDADGRRSHAVDLPSANPPGGRHDRARPVGMLDDADAIRDSLRRIDGPVVVIAHSYGGVPTTQAIGDAANVVGAVYLAAFQLDVGESMFTFLGAPVPDDGTGQAPPYEDSRRVLFGDMSRADADRAAARLRPQSVRSFTEPVTTAGWRTVPSSYVVCDHDRALEPSRQRELATRAGSVHRLPSSHSPFLSMPRRLATLLGRIAGPAMTRPGRG